MSRQRKTSTTRSRAPAAEVTQAQRRAAVILEVLAGIRTAQEAAGVLEISCNHYYILERKALAGLVAACQPAPRRGPPRKPEQELARLQRELERVRGECQRQAALVRATQRAVGVPVTSDEEGKTKRRGKSAKPRRRRREPRGVRAARALQKQVAEADAQAVQPTSADVGGQPTPPPVQKESTDGPSRS